MRDFPVGGPGAEVGAEVTGVEVGAEVEPEPGAAPGAAPGAGSGMMVVVLPGAPRRDAAGLAECE